MSSSDSDSEDENIALLRQAVDTNFMSDDLFAATLPTTNGATVATKCTSSKTVSNANAVKPVDQPKSLRYIDYDDIEADLNVPKSMQDFVYKKMSTKIADSIEFVEITKKKDKKRKQSDDLGAHCVRLLKDTDPITKINVDHDLAPVKSSTKIEIKRRQIEPDNCNDDEKIKMAVIDGEAVLQQIDTKGWKVKKPKAHKIFNYRSKKSVLHLVEPPNEFSTLRKKNEWNESKIANSPWKNYQNN